MLAIRAQVDVPQAVAVDGHHTVVGEVVADDHIDDGGLAHAALAHQGDGLAGLDVQMEIGQNGVVLLVGEVDTGKVEGTLHVGEGYLALAAFLFLGVHQLAHRGHRLDAADKGGNHGQNHGHAGNQHGEIVLIQLDIAHLGDGTV